MQYKGLLKVADSELENVTGGCLIDMNCDGSVNFVKVSREEFELLKSSKCFSFGSLRVRDLPRSKSCLRKAGFRVTVKTTVIPRRSLWCGYDASSLGCLVVKCIVE